MPVLAHAGDFVSSVVMLAPIFGVLIWVLIVRWRERRQSEDQTKPRRGGRDR